MCTPTYAHTVYTRRQINVWNLSTELNHLAAPATLPGLYHSTEVSSSRIRECVFLSDRVLLFSADGGHPATKRQLSKNAGLAIPANHSGHRDRWNRVPPIGSFVSQCSSFVLEGHQIQSAECLSFRRAERTAFILLSLWPSIKAVELEGSWKMAAFWQYCGLFPVETEWIWSCVFVLTLKSLVFKFLKQAYFWYNFCSSNSLISFTSMP